MTNKMYAVDFFCGAGGFSEGFKQAGIPVLAALDNHKACEHTYRKNHPKTQFIRRDIIGYSPQELKSFTGIGRHNDNMIFIGCAPCQYWSNIRHIRNKSYQSRNLLLYFCGFVEFFRPGFVVVENVTGVFKNKRDSGLNDLCTSLERHGYDISISDVFSVKDFGVPQTRRRFLLIASRCKNRDIVLCPTTETPSTVRDTIGHLKPIKAGMTDPEDPLHVAARLEWRNILRLKKTPEGGDRSSWMNDEELLINCYRDKPISYHRHNYGRMAWNKPAPTITTRFTSIGCGQFGHPKQNRAISLREGALLQTFPKKYEFPRISMEEDSRSIGNAVPPKFAKAVGKAIKR